MFTLENVSEKKRQKKLYFGLMYLISSSSLLSLTLKKFTILEANFFSSFLACSRTLFIVFNPEKNKLNNKH